METTETLITREQIEGTPFTLIHQENKWFLVMGDYRVTEPTLHKQDTLDKLDSEKWMLITHISVRVNEIMNNNNNKNN